MYSKDTSLRPKMLLYSFFNMMKSFTIKEMLEGIFGPHKCNYAYIVKNMSPKRKYKYINANLIKNIISEVN